MTWLLGKNEGFVMKLQQRTGTARQGSRMGIPSIEPQGASELLIVNL
jgi:hypothetical protein